MTRYNDQIDIDDYDRDAYRAGVDRVLEYIESIHRYDGLMRELRWAIGEGII